MTWDPAEFLRGDIPALSPLDRARVRGEAAEGQEQRQAARRQAERRAESEAAAARQQMADRRALLERGYTDGQLAERQAQRDAERDEEIAQLEARLDQIHPGRRQAAAQRAQQAPQQAREAVTLMRARRDDPFMRREINRMQARADRERGAWLRDEIALETRRAAAEAAGEISRSQGRVNGTALPAAEERYGTGDDVRRDADGRWLQCVFVPDGRGGHKHVKHGGRCLLHGETGDATRTASGTGWPELHRETATAFTVS